MNHYQILQVKISGSPQEIKQAYRRLVKEFHPDSQHENANHEKIIKLNVAYETLSDPKNRRIYDQQLANNSNYRQNKSNHASEYYHQNKNQSYQEEISQAKWLKQVYSPIIRLVNSIISPLDEEIEQLSADIFDDELMGIFLEYLENCRHSCNQAKQILQSQANPRLYAGIAAYMYYGLNHIDDGIDELERFTMTYEESYLYDGQELFNLALETTGLARSMVQRFY
jgi:molecular chaperone DnaJ